jgi:hypothetical protein
MTGERVIRLLFVSAIWLFLALNGYRVIAHVMEADSIMGAYPGGYGARVFIAPLFLLLFELFLWFRLFRWSRHPARLFAGIIGAYIWLMVIFVNLVTADLYGRELSPALWWLYAYAGAGHVLFALFGRERTG